MEQYEIDALDMAGIWVRMAGNKSQWVVYVNGISRARFDDREQAEQCAMDLAYDLMSEGPIQSISDFCD